MSFANLHVHSEFSLLDGLLRIPDAVAKVQADGQHHLALTEHGNMYSVIEHYKTCTAAGVHPVLGIEAYVTPDAANKVKDTPTWHMVLLAKNNVGLRNLYQLSTDAFLHGFYGKPRMDYASIAKHSEGVIAMSACLGGEIPQAILAEDSDGYRTAARRWLEVFGRDFYFELQPNSMPEQFVVNKRLIELGTELGVKTVVTCDAHYVNQGDHKLHNLLWRIGTHSDKEWLPEFWLWNEQELLAKGFNQADLDRTVTIAEQCDASITLDAKHYVKFDCPGGVPSEQFLTTLALDALRDYAARTGVDLGVYSARLAYELSVILPAGFADYFLVVWDYIKFAKENGVLIGPGRGSGAGSLLTFLLGVTGLDPIKYGIMFERFLTPGRTEMPDQDIDFDESGRSKLMAYLISKYGYDRVSLIGTFSQIGLKTAIRDTGRVLGMPKHKVDSVAELAPDDESLTKMTLVPVASAMELEPKMAELYHKDPMVKELLDTADNFIGLHRNTSSHASGVVIADCPLVELMPLKREKVDESDDLNYATQFDMKSVEALGVLKYDILKLDTLDMIADVQTAIGQPVDLYSIPLDDPATFELIRAGNTIGVFQLSSYMMRKLCRGIQPTNIQDLAIVNAMGRPSILDAGLDQEFIDRKDGSKEVKYLHPSLIPHIKNTQGIMLYQDQILLIAVHVAGYTWQEADKLRKIMGKKLKEEMPQQEAKFIAGCIATVSMAEEVARELFKEIAYYASYGFGHGHAVCYGYVGYMTAYLKTHHPIEFYCALLTRTAGKNSKDTEKKLAEIFGDAINAGIPILPPDINRSESKFIRDGESIRFGLSALLKLKPDFVQKLVDKRPYESWDDLVGKFNRNVLNKGRLHSLIVSGALDRFGSRPDLLHRLEIHTCGTKKGKAELETQAVPNVQLGELMAMQGAVCNFTFLPDTTSKHDPWPLVKNWQHCKLYGYVAEQTLNIVSKNTGKTYSRFKLQTQDSVVTCFVFDAIDTLDQLVPRTIRLVSGKKSMKPGMGDSLIVDRIALPKFKEGV